MLISSQRFAGILSIEAPVTTRLQNDDGPTERRLRPKRECPSTSHDGQEGDVFMRSWAVGRRRSAIGDSSLISSLRLGANQVQSPEMSRMLRVAATRIEDLLSENRLLKHSLVDVRRSMQNILDEHDAAEHPAIEALQAVLLRTDVGFGISSTNQKPGANAWNKYLDDYHSFAKTGKVIYGEWFVNGERIAGGDHSQPLPVGRIGDTDDVWTLRDAEPREPDFPTLEDDVDITDGAAGQFQGKRNTGHVARSRAKTGVTKTSVIKVSKHGKDLADVFGNLLASFLQQGSANGRFLIPGPRGSTLYLAQYHRKPLGSLEKVVSDFAPERYLYVYYSDEVLGVGNRDFNAYKDTKQFHSRVGRCVDPVTAEQNGPLTIREVFCACTPCAPPNYDFEHCLVPRLVGRPKQVYTRPVAAAIPVQTRLQSEQESRLALVTFATTISAGEVRAVRVHEDDREIEGNFWLAKITSEMFIAPEGGFVFAGEEFPADFLLVKIRWFQALSLISESQARPYRLLSDERCLSVMSIMRIEPVETMQVGQSRSNRFEVSAAEQLRIMEST